MSTDRITELKARIDALGESERAAMRERDDAEERVTQIRNSLDAANAALDKTKETPS